MSFRTIVPGAAGLILVLAVYVTGTSAAQTDRQSEAPNPTAQPAPPAGHLELPHDPYVPVRECRLTPAGRFTRDGYVSVQVNVTAAGHNIAGDAANEPSIAADPTDFNHLAIGWRQFDSVSNDFRQAGWALSRDGGRSWKVSGKIEPGVFRSDPVLESDADGNFYYNSLTANLDTNDFWCHVYKMRSASSWWDTGTYAYGGDKQWMTIDRTDGPGRGNIYAFWTQYWSICSPGHFTRSYDGSSSYKPCIEVMGNPYWGTLTVGPDGEVYVCGDGFTVTKSSTLQYELQPPAWDFTRTVSLDGSMASSGGPNPGGLLGQAWIAVDHSDGATRSNVYLLCSVNRSSTPDPMDVMFARSTNGGSTWSAPVRVNDDLTNSAYQWFGTMSVAPNGRIDVIWNDTRSNLGSYNSELYYSYSTDAGVTWSPNEAVSPSFNPHDGWPQQNKIGDYYDMVSDNLGAHVAYAATLNGEQDIYYVRLGESDCNNNGIADSSDISGGASLDCNLNAVPDECESLADYDFDGSGEVDLEDYTALVSCLAGPDTPPDPPVAECAGMCLEAFDGDEDGDVDLADFGAMEQTFTALPPAACCLPDGSCVDTSETSCAAQDGSYQGDFTECAYITCPAPNDDCAGAIPIYLGNTNFSTLDATTDGPSHASCEFDGQTYNDIWFAYTDTCGGSLRVSTCDTANYDTDLVVYSGCDCPVSDAELLGCDDDTTGCAGYTSEVTVPVSLGECYLIRIGGYGDDDQGTGTVLLECVSP